VLHPSATPNLRQALVLIAGESAAEAAGDAQCEARVRSDVVVDTDVAVPGEDREGRDHLGEGEVLSYAAARAESERDQRPVPFAAGGEMTIGIESLGIGPCRWVVVRGTYVDGDNLPAPNANRLFAGL
jgi:hypothetical protein